MEKAYKYRIYPNKRQKELLAKTFGCCRFVYNHFLNKRIETYQKEQKTLTYNQCSSEFVVFHIIYNFMLHIIYHRFRNCHSGFSTLFNPNYAY